jgi:3-hydroxybutyryl-CoA dehydratase
LKKEDRFIVKYKVSEKLYQGFIALFEDKNPLHTDTAFAQKKGFSSVVMHGNILGGFLSHFIGECLPSKDVIIHSQEIKYLNPVYLNDELSLVAVIQEIYESVAVVEIKYHFENAGGVKVAKGKINIGLIQ